ncbi:hypothetical protein [Winogradskyella sp.]|uniref:hypothetical protein n=1 Tax=Winogradskyella sp. TaxID=1883156 RepID=UPI003BAA665D
MKNKKINSYILPVLLIAAAFGGFYLIMIGSNWQKRGYFYENNSYDIKLIILGLAAMIPLFIFLFTLKPTPKTKLRGNNARLRNQLRPNRKKAKNTCFVYIQNKTAESLIVNRKSILEEEQWYIFELKFEETLYFSNGITIERENDDLLEIHDFRNQITGLSKDDFRSYDIPDYVDFALLIGAQNEGEFMK